MSPKRLLGWEPTETHEHEYDDQGRLVRTIVTREPEWDDTERNKMHDLAVYEAEVHPGCGQHDSVAGTMDLRLEPLTCPDCADIEVAMREQAERDKAQDAKLGDNPPASAKLATDGRRWTIRQRSAEEVATEPAKPAPKSRRRSTRR